MRPPSGMRYMVGSRSGSVKRGLKIGVLKWGAQHWGSEIGASVMSFRACRVEDNLLSPPGPSQLAFPCPDPWGGSKKWIHLKVLQKSQSLEFGDQLFESSQRSG